MYAPDEAVAADPDVDRLVLDMSQLIDLAAVRHLRQVDDRAIARSGDAVDPQPPDADDVAARLDLLQSLAGGLAGKRGDGRRERERELKELRIDPKAIDPEDPELLADLVMAAANEALRAAHAKVEAKMKGMLPPDLGGLLPGL